VSLNESINNEAFNYYPALRRIREYVEANYSAPLSLAQAAAEVAMERKYFSKFFKDKVGVGFKEWIETIRVEKAIQAIRKEHGPLSDIAFAVGFQDVTTFERVFKKYTNMTPRDFRKAVQSELRRSA
jgi:two-component system response regulator YesN